MTRALSQPSQVLGSPAMTMRDFGDATAMRKLVYQNALTAAQGLKPYTNARHSLSLSKVDYADEGEFSLADQKNALLAGDSLYRRLRGTWTLSDTAGQVLDQKRQTIAHVPYVTPRGTMIHNGNAYVIVNQQRLQPGMYTRIKDNGELETHANILPGDGVAHRYFLDPEKGIFYTRLKQAKIPLLPLLRAMGASDAQLREAWGPELLAANMQNESPAALRKYYDRLLRAQDRELPENEQKIRLVEILGAMKLNPKVTKRTLGKAYEFLTPDAILAATRKLIAVSRGEAESDDRDHLAFQTIIGPEDLIAERIAKDYGGLRRKLFHRASWQGNLNSIPTNALNRQVEAAILHSGLGQSLEEINPAEVFDKQSRISRLGEGGIPSIDAVPDEARTVQPSHFGFMDPIRTPESFKVGVDVHIARSVRKGNDGKIYAPFRDVKTGKTVYKSPQDVADLAIAFPGEMAREGKRVWAMYRGKEKAVLKKDVNLEMEHFENAFSSLGNMIPLKSTTKGQRMAMASRMLTQAVPLTNPEAPLVQSGVPGEPGKSFESLYGKHMGAVRATKPGKVMEVNPGSIRVRYRDGSEEDIELYQNFPYNRKTYLHQTPLVEVGQQIQEGQMLARSNYTNDRGETALGVNLRVAYIPFRGLNYEDAVVISQSAAKKMTSEHMYQHRLEPTDEHKLGKKTYLGLFPGKLSREVADKFDDDGVILPGTEISFDDPLILAAKTVEPGRHKVHRRGSSSFKDASITWNHHSQGVVTDVYKGKKGTTVLVKATSPMQVGDKLCFDPETQLLTKTGWKPVAEIAQEDLLATLNPETDHLEWHAPDRLHSYRYQGQMYRLKTKHLDMLVTPEHDLWVCRPGKEYRKVKAKDFYASKGEWQFKKDVMWAGREQAVFVPQEIFRHTSQSNLIVSVSMDTWLEFLGYYIAEGRRTRTTSKGWQVQISQFASSSAWLDIADCLNELGYRWSYNESANRFEINSKQLYLSLGDCGDGAYLKTVPGYVQELSSRQLRIFFGTYMDGDGHRGACWEYGTSSEQLSQDLELVLLKIGWCGSPRLVERDDNFQKREHWRTRVNRKHLRPWWRKRRVLQYDLVVEEMTDYAGMVYCVTVANHLVYAKRGGKSYWSGNSGRYG